jgi:hypothetical protein
MYGLSAAAKLFSSAAVHEWSVHTAMYQAREMHVPALGGDLI